MHPKPTGIRVEPSPILAEELHYPSARAPEHGQSLEVAPGVHWLRMPLPFEGLDHINLWLLEDGDGWTVVDCGLSTSMVRALWEDVFSRMMNGRPVKRVIASHFHPDHLGLAHWLTERWGCRLWMTRSEWLFGRMLSLDAPEVPPDSVVRFYARLGLSDEALDVVRKSGFGNYRKGVPSVPESYRRIADNEVIEIGGVAWRVLVGRGHAPEQACLYCAERGIMISGDQILPRITPHIGVYSAEPEANPLAEYLDSLGRFDEVPEDTLILPSHKLPFVGLHRRIEQLHEHHRERLDVLWAACAEPKTTVQTLPYLFSRDLDHFHTLFALGESLAHLNYLLAEGRIALDEGPDGIYRYRQVAAPSDRPGPEEEKR